MKKFLETLACIMNDTWYRDCYKHKEPRKHDNTEFMSMLAGLMGDKRLMPDKQPLPHKRIAAHQ
ncbi:hypothetical protein WJT86_00175 [Microvirga sp. W0021]|uniref:Transposase n=1 Tax=Hohaiivirga grylli TaxID=3133970 RepID=A0ABV0BGP1_9HYPH